MSSINRNAPPPPPGSTPRPTGPEQQQAQVQQGLGKAAPKTTRAAELNVEQQPPPETVPQRKMSQAEAERFYSQAGFVRAGRKQGKGLDLSGVTDGAIPLPIEDVDEAAWDQGSLDEAQGEMTSQMGQLGELQTKLQGATKGDPQAPFTALLGIAFAPTAEDLARLEALDATEAPPAPQLDDVNGSIAALFGKQLGGVQVGPAMLAAALVVAGSADAVQPEGDTLQADKMVGGLQSVLQRGHGAVQDARTMSSGITLHRAKQQTLIVKKKP